MQNEYYRTKETVAEYIKLAKDVNGKFLIEKLEQVLPLKSTLLEIGSGPGTDWQILNKLYRAVGSDNSIEFLDHLRSKNPIGDFLELDAITLKTDKKFDGIYSNKVLQHLKDNELTSSIKRQYEVLNSAGVICHSFWKGNGSEIFKGLFVNYHSEADIKKVYKNYFEIISIESYNEFEGDDSLLLIGRKKKRI